MMNRFLLFLAFNAVLITAVNGQDNTPKDSVSVEDIDYKKPHQDLLLVDLNWDYLIGANGATKQKWYGRGIAVELVYDYPLTKNGNVSAAIGGGFQSHNYYMNSLVSRSDKTFDNGDVRSVSQFKVAPDSVLDRGKISVNYVDVPVELRFRTNENSKGYRWKMAVGGRVGYLMNAHEKIINKQDVKIKTYNYPHISRWRYGVSARVGYGSVMLTGFYSISPFFYEKHSVLTYNSFTLGVTIVPF